MAKGDLLGKGSWVEGVVTAKAKGNASMYTAVQVALHGLLRENQRAGKFKETHGLEETYYLSSTDLDAYRRACGLLAKRIYAADETLTAWIGGITVKLLPGDDLPPDKLLQVREQ